MRQTRFGARNQARINGSTQWKPSWRELWHLLRGGRVAVDTQFIQPRTYVHVVDRRGYGLPIYSTGSLPWLKEDK